MNLHIHSAGCVSPQSSWGRVLPERWVQPEGNRFSLSEPNYGSILDPKLLRRMSRVIRFGSAAAMDTMSRAPQPNPDAIIVGTAYGCLQDTETFLTKMVEQDEQLLTPTAFIQSTHNTVGAQVALMLGCHGYNNTFVHRGHGFESALLDASLLLDEGYGMVLAGAVDELTDTSLHLLRRYGVHSQDGPGKRGVAAGEGAAFFTLSRQARQGDLARLTGLRLIRSNKAEAITSACSDMIRLSEVVRNEVDLVLHGGQPGHASQVAADALGKMFPSAACVAYKPFSGDHPSASAFALWMAVGLLSNGAIPDHFPAAATGKPLKKVLVFNSWLDRFSSLFLLEHAQL